MNGELDALETLLEQAKHIVRPGGRLLILSYHSLEDRRVKRVLASGNLKVRLVGICRCWGLGYWLRARYGVGERQVFVGAKAE